MSCMRLILNISAAPTLIETMLFLFEGYIPMPFVERKFPDRDPSSMDLSAQPRSQIRGVTMRQSFRRYS